MNAKELNKTLREEARFLGLCDEWYNAWKDYSEDELVDRMYKGIDFVLKHHWPTNDFIKKNFKQEFLRSHGVFVDDTYSACNTQESLVLGHSDIRYRYSGRYCGIINLRDNSTAYITARGDGLVIVHMLDNATVKVEQSEKARVAVIKHSHNVSVEVSPGVKVLEEYDYLA